MCGVPEDTKLMHLFMHKIVQVSFQSGCFCFQRHFSFFPFTLLSLVRLEADRKWTKRLGERGLLIQAWPHAVFKVLQLNCIFSICIVYTVLAESNTFNLMQKRQWRGFFSRKVKPTADCIFQTMTPSAFRLVAFKVCFYLYNSGSLRK